jgi:hypothetical protein
MGPRRSRTSSGFGIKCDSKLQRVWERILFTMKYLTITAFVLLSCSAKNQSIVETNAVEKGYVFPNSTSNNLLRNPNTFWLTNKDEKEIQELIADNNAKFYHKTSLGSVYILSEDGMACLVPDVQKVERIPGRKLNDPQHADRMPNASPKQKILIIPIK